MQQSVFAQYYGHPMMGNDGWGLVMLFWTALFILGTLLAVRLLRRDSLTNQPTADPLAIIKERYAKGELTKEQFDQIKKDLSTQ